MKKSSQDLKKVPPPDMQLWNVWKSHHPVLLHSMAVVVSSSVSCNIKKYINPYAMSASWSCAWWRAKPPKIPWTPLCPVEPGQSVSKFSMSQSELMNFEKLGWVELAAAVNSNCGCVRLSLDFYLNLMYLCVEFLWPSTFIYTFDKW